MAALDELREKVLWFRIRYTEIIGSLLIIKNIFFCYNIIPYQTDT